MIVVIFYNNIFWDQQREETMIRRFSEPLNSDYDYPRAFLSRTQVFIILKWDW